MMGGMGNAFFARGDFRNNTGKLLLAHATHQVMCVRTLVLHTRCIILQ